MAKENMHKKANRLINEKSPYLLQHAHNPVDWYPWGEEAFNKAKKEDKPIFLSIGYSTCHWCHVMERESFEDEEVSKILNDNFIAIKVDREERPDIDSIYMTFCQALTGSGGWPLTIIMSGDKKPFFAGTYFPKENKYNMAGLIYILKNISSKWKSNKEELINHGEKITEAIKGFRKNYEKKTLDFSVVEETFLELKNDFDEVYGGFSYSPKFPIPHNLIFLLRYYYLTKNKDSLYMVEKTLEGMYKGGIFDHLGYGFSRYSTDEKWLVPHFEKMLYDNALLIYTYAEAYHLTKKPFYREVCEKIIEYIIRDMISREGGFYSAEDADSEGEEGKFYLFTKEELKKYLKEEELQEFNKWYDLSENIINLIKSDINRLEEDEKLKERIEGIIKKLYKVRENRIHPFKDDKILTSWNGLMIAALSYGGRVFNEKRYIDAAKASLAFIEKNLVTKEGRLLARFREGEAAINGYLEDYSYLLWGIVELYEATLDKKYLKKGIKLFKDMMELFWDDSEGGFFLYGKDSESLILRPKESYDGALPSANSVAALNILRLSRITSNLEMENIFDEILNSFSSDISGSKISHTFMVTALLSKLSSFKEIVISGEEEREDTKEFIEKLTNRYLPFSTILYNDLSEDLISIIPSLEGKTMVDNKATVYICENYSCKEPIINIESINRL